MSEKSSAEIKIQDREYHPAVVSACELLWDDDEYNVTFQPEHPVTREPIRTDLLIVKKNPKPFKDKIGSFFRTYNFIQFKSESDKFEPNDVLNELIYVYSYKVHNPSVEFRDCSVSIFCPPGLNKVVSFLEENGFPVRQSKDPSISYVDLDFGLKMQIVVLGDLVGEYYEYAPLNVFTKKLNEQRIVDLAKYRETYIPPTDTVRQERLHTIVGYLYDKAPALKEIISRVMGTNVINFQEFLKSLFPEVLAAYKEEGIKQGREEGREAEKQEALDLLLRSARNTAIKFKVTFEEALDNCVLPDWCSREEALTKMYAM